MGDRSKPAKPFILVGPRSTSDLTYGMSIGFDLLISGFEERTLPFQVVDRSEGIVGCTVGVFSLGGGASLKQLFRFYWHLWGAAGVYLTIGTSKTGLLRDLLMLIPAIMFRKRVVLHLKGGGFLDLYNAQQRWLQAFIRAVYKRVDAIIVLGNLLRDQFSFLPNADILTYVVPNGLPDELDKRMRDGGGGKHLTANEPISLLYLSNMIESKGYQEVLEACHTLHERGIPIRADICGQFVQTAHSDTEIDGSSQTRFMQHITAWMPFGFVPLSSQSKRRI